MSTNERKDQDATGEALSRDSLQRLAKLRVDVTLLGQLVRTRRLDASQDGAAALRLDEMAGNLAWLETRIGQVLDDRAESEEDINAEALDKADGEALMDDDATQDAGEPASDADAKPYAAGITLDQIDEINLLLESILAQGDVVTAADHAEFAVSTLSVIGYNIYRETGQVREMLSAILDDQKLAPPRRPRPGVREDQASYLALPARLPLHGTTFMAQERPTYQ